MGFQASPAFQTPLAFQPHFPPAAQNSGGYLTSVGKTPKEGVFYDIYTGRRVPKPVQDVIEQIVKADVPTKKERKIQFKSALPDLEARVIKIYLDILEEAYRRYVDEEITRLLREQTARDNQLEEDEMIILLLLNSY